MANKKQTKTLIKKEDKLAVDKICQNLANEQNLEFVETTWVNEQHGLVLTVYIYKDNGISLDDCENYHKALHSKLERFDYDFLEVSSLGIDRPIKTKRDFERHAGELVEVKLFAKENNKKIYCGNIIDFDDDYVSIQINTEILKFNHKNIAIVKPIIDLDAELESVELTE